MQLALVFALILVYVKGQSKNLTGEDLADLWKILNTSTTTTATTTTTCRPGTFCLPGLVPVSTSTTESSMSATDKCGEGTMNKRLCVNYEFCDLQTDTITLTRRRAGAIDIGRNIAKCGDIFERCCKIPEGGLPPDFNPNTTPSPDTTVSPRPPPSFASSQCGIRNANGIDVKITGNNDSLAEYGEFPWMVALINNTNPSPKESFSYCGGSLITPNVVLTVAHCVSPYKSDPSKIKIRVGEWNSKSTSEKFPYQEKNVANIIIHKDFDRILNDVALVILEEPVEKDEHIGTICLPNQDEVIDSRNCFVSGWGETTDEEGIYLDILKKVNVPIVPEVQCQNTLRKTLFGEYFKVHESLVCAGGEAAKDSCKGDGGSPLVCPHPNNPQRYVLAGMVVGGLGCGEEFPALYAKVVKFRSWIDEEMRKLNLNTNTYKL